MPNIQPADVLAQAGSLSRRRRNRLSDHPETLPIGDPVILEPLTREFDDCEPNGTDRDNLPYKIATNGHPEPIAIPRRSSVVPVTNTGGKIYGLHDLNGNWFTKPVPHFSNLKRAPYTGQIEVFDSTEIADLEAFRRNISTAAINGLPWQRIVNAVAHLNVTLVDRTSRKFAPTRLNN